MSDGTLIVYTVGRSWDAGLCRHERSRVNELFHIPQV